MEDQCIISHVVRDDDLCKSPCLKSLPEKVVTCKKAKSQRRLFHQFFCCFRPTSSTVAQQDVFSPLPQSPTILTTASSSVVPVAPAADTCQDAEPDSETTAATAASDVDECLLEPALPVIGDTVKKKKCAVIDLDETLVHSSFAPVTNADFIIPVEIDGTVHQVYVLKRPHVDEFLQRIGQLFDCILFTASLGKYADPVADLLDQWGVFQARLFRESCVFHRGNYVKDLSRLGRELNQIIIIDNSPASYMFHPQNAVPVVSWFDDPSDCELLKMLPLIENLASIDDVYTILSTLSPPPQPVINGFLNNHHIVTTTHDTSVIAMAMQQVAADDNSVAMTTGIDDSDSLVMMSMEDSDLDEESFEKATVS